MCRLKLAEGDVLRAAPAAALLLWCVCVCVLAAHIATVSSRWPHLWQQQHPTMPSPFSTKGGSSAITGSNPPPPAAAAALAISMLWMASKHLAWF